MSNIACPACGRKLKMTEDLRGQPVKCPTCGDTFQAPAFDAEPPEAELPEVEEADLEPVGRREKYCYECGARIRARAVVCPKCGVEQPLPLRAAQSNRIAAGICGILVGGFGVHKFILGLTGPAVTMLVVTLVGAVLSPCLFVPIFAPMVMGVIGLVEGIIYLTKSDEQFYQDYVVRKKGWF